jgi:hypothetical protein
LEKILAEELNVKEINAAPDIAAMPETVLRENSELQVLLSVKISPELKAEGYARELERQVQDLRKKHGLNVGDLIDLYYNTADSSLETALVENLIARKPVLSRSRKN